MNIKNIFKKETKENKRGLQEFIKRLWTDLSDINPKRVGKKED